MVFEPGTDLLRARQLVQERLTQAVSLPNVSKPPVMLQPLSSTSRVMLIGLSSSELSELDRSILARWTIRPRLMGVPGVANVAIWGQREQQLQVLVDPERLRERDVTLNQVISTTGNAQLVSPLSFLEASTPGSGGFIDTPNQRLQIRHILPITTPDELSRVVVEGTNRKLRLGDVAELREGHQPLIGDAVVGDGEGLLLVVEKFPGANTLDVTRGVEDALEALQPGLAGIEVDTTVFRPATFIERAIDNLTVALAVGGLLVGLILIAFLLQWRTVLVSLVAIPLSLVAAGLVLSLTGASINTLAIAGLVIALGVVVDDAIVGIENAWRRLHEQQARSQTWPRASVILESLLEVRGPIVYATLIVLVAVLPVVFMEGLSGVFFEPLALSYALAVLASMVVALTVTPALSLMLLSRAPLERGDAPPARWLKDACTGVLSKVIARPGAAYLAVGVVAVLGLAVLPGLSGPFIPSFKERDLLIRFDGAPGTSHPEMRRIAARAGRELRSIPGVRNVGAHVGRAVTSDQVVGVNAGQLWVSLDADADYDQTLDSVQAAVEGYPGLARDVLTYSKQRIRDVGAVDDGEDPQTGTDDLDVLTGAANDPLVVRVYGGENLPVLRRQARKVQRAVSAVEGVVDPRVKLPVQEPTLEIEVNLQAAQRYGIKPGDVRRAAATLLQGIQVGALFERAEGVRRAGGGEARGAQQRDQRPRAPDRHARGRARALGRRGRSARRRRLRA